MFLRRRSRSWHLIMWIGGLIFGLKGANYLSNSFGVVKDVAQETHNPGVISLSADSEILQLYSSNSLASGRHLLTLPNCTPRAVEQFPRDMFTQQQRMKGALALHIFCVLYMFLCLAIVCDVYFVPSLEVLCEMLNIQSDVAGATFMAAGSSAPELATSVIGVFIAKDDVGLSTVVGSAIYNVMFVISVCGFAAKMPVPLTWWPLVRDATAYLVSIIALIVVIYDEKVMWYESIIFLGLYFLYIVFMFYNKPLEMKVLPACFCCPTSHKQIPDQVVVHYEKISEQESNGSVKISGERTPIKEIDSIGERTPIREIDSIGERTPIKEIDSKKSNGYVVTGEDGVGVKSNGRRLSTDSVDYSDDSDSEVHEVNMDKEESVWQQPSGCIARFLWILAIPANILMYISMPDCRKPRFKRWFWITFLMSLVWLSLFSFLMVWMITVIGFSVSIPDSVMSLTLIAFGVSLPDVVASVLVIKDGLGDMAVSNAVGSNVFDILVCLGVPWCIKTCMLNPGSHVTVYSEGLLYSSITLLSTVLLLIVGIHVNNWRLNKKVSFFFMFIYIGFTILTCLYELNIFGYFHPVECPSNY